VIIPEIYLSRLWLHKYSKQSNLFGILAQIKFMKAWRTMTASSDVVSFMKASSMVLSSFDSDYSGGNPRSGASGLNDGGARRRYPLWASVLEQTSAGDGVAPGETPDLGLPDRMMATHDAALPAGGIVFGVNLG
jgi:hypothetical protein